MTKIITQSPVLREYSSEALLSRRRAHKHNRRVKEASLISGRSSDNLIPLYPEQLPLAQ